MSITWPRDWDGRFCQPADAMPPDQRARLVALTHVLCHRDGLSLRQAQRALESYGAHRSVGWLSGTLRMSVCGWCGGTPQAAAAQAWAAQARRQATAQHEAAQRPRARVRSWSVLGDAGGGL